MTKKLKGGNVQNTNVEPTRNVEPIKSESISMTTPQAEKILEKSESWYNSIKKLADKAGLGETLDKAIDAVKPIIKGAGSFINSATDGRLDGSSVVKMVSGIAEIGNGVLEGVSKSLATNSSNNVKKVLSTGGEVVGLIKDAGVALGSLKLAGMMPDGTMKAQALEYGTAKWAAYNSASPLEKFNAMNEAFNNVKVSELGGDLKTLFSEVGEHSAAHVYHGAADVWAAGCDMSDSISPVLRSLFVNTLIATGEKLQEVYNNPEAIDIIKGAAIGGVMLGGPGMLVGRGVVLGGHGMLAGAVIGGEKSAEILKGIVEAASYTAGKIGEGFSAAKDGASYAAEQAKEYFNSPAGQDAIKGADFAPVGLASGAVIGGLVGGPMGALLGAGISSLAGAGAGAAIGGEKLAEIWKGINDFFSENYVKLFPASPEPADQQSTNARTEEAVHDVNAKLYDLTHKLDDAMHKMVTGEGIASKINDEFSQVKEAIDVIKYPAEMSFGDKIYIDQSFQNLSKMADVLIKGNPDDIKAAMQQFANDHQKIINHFEALEKSDAAHTQEWHADVDTLKADHAQMDGDIKAYEDAHHD